jgi:hypothetical protein
MVPLKVAVVSVTEVAADTVSELMRSGVTEDDLNVELKEVPIFKIVVAFAVYDVAEAAALVIPAMAKVAMPLEFRVQPVGSVRMILPGVARLTSPVGQ